MLASSPGRSEARRKCTCALDHFYKEKMSSSLSCVLHSRPPSPSCVLHSHPLFLLCFICPHNSSGGQACVFSPRRWELQTSSSLRNTQLLCMGMDPRAQCISCYLQGVYSPRYSCSCRVYCTHRPTWCINNPCACCNQGNRDVGVDSHRPPGPLRL